VFLFLKKKESLKPVNYSFSRSRLIILVKPKDQLLKIKLNYDYIYFFTNCIFNNNSYLKITNL